MKDYAPHELITAQVENFREWWNELTPAQRPPGLDMEAVFIHIVEKTVLPEVSYRLDQVIYYDQGTYPEPSLIASLPYRKYPEKPESAWNSLRLYFTLHPPFGTRKAWKITANLPELQGLLKRFRLEFDPIAVTEAIEKTTRIPFLNGNGKRYRPYRTEAEATAAVGKILLKLGLVKPLRGIDEMHEISAWDA
jgi:hypothetical protein